jgi:thiol:disulfide interchange protein
MKPRERSVWGTTSRRPRLPTLLLVTGAGLALMGAVAGLGYLLALLVRMLLATGSPFGAAICLGGVVLVGLASGVVGVRVAARRLTVGSTAQRAMILGGMVLLMALAPFTMIAIVVALALQGGP